MKKTGIILSIESAIQGGSLSISEKNRELDFWIGTKTVSKSEDLLEEISALLIKNKLEKKDIELLAVSNLIGSYTGIRIGLATALGLKKALGCRIAGVSVLAAIARLITEEGTFTVAVSDNSRNVYSQNFVKTSEGIIEETNLPKVLKYEEFCRIFKSKTSGRLITNQGLFDLISENEQPNDFDKSLVHNTGNNLAKFLGSETQARV